MIFIFTTKTKAYPPHLLRNAHQMSGGKVRSEGFVQKQWIVVASGLILFSSFLGGVYLYKKGERGEVKPFQKPSDVALALIDVLGDNDGIKPGTMTAECLSAKVDLITDQYDILLSKIHNNPGTTHYIDGLYVTLLPVGRRPIFQVRFPDRKYCADFAEKYRACYASAPKETEHDKLVLPPGRCIKEAAREIRVTENWEGLIEKYGPQPPAQ